MTATELPPYQLREISELIPYARNSRTHSDSQIKQLVASIQEFGFTNPVIIDQDNNIIAGHGRVMAAQQLNMPSVPTIQLSHLSEEQKRAYVIADNQLALQAGWDKELLRSELGELKSYNFDLTIIGFNDSQLSGIFDEVYTRSIETPIYEIKGDCPNISELCNEKKTNELKKEIAAADLPKNVASFLKKAAERHTVFDFAKIAEYYAHADAPTQRLMEKSALVIIDFDQAIESGFVRLTKKMRQLAGMDAKSA